MVTYEAGLKQRGSLTDSTGLKVYGEGEWKVHQHGWTQRRTGRKLPATGDIVAQVLTPPGQDDASQVEPLLKQVEAPIDALAEPQMFRYKRIIGPGLQARNLANPARSIGGARKSACGRVKHLGGSRLVTFKLTICI